ncbi:hypothetical protein O181_127961 [Austropuccinia psidii MF-1]|uniref:Uncharacterized protein n=1 Tax=Austropuccinia psidii MF-1 TaxID=1389203 RepID=A0A9Q3Q791_9BASI|nr:hypothetical protein [Austropuccinia psidii MF-1]
MSFKTFSPIGMKLRAASEIRKLSIHQEESSRIEGTEESESQSSTRVKAIFLATNKIPFSALYDEKTEFNVSAQEIALKERLNIIAYIAISKDNSLKTIGQIRNLEFTFCNKEKKYMEFLVFENLNQIIVEQSSSISTLSK